MIRGLAQVEPMVVQIAGLLVEGHSVAAIGARLGLSKGSVSGLVRRHIQGKREIQVPRAKRERKAKAAPAPVAPSPFGVTGPTCQWTESWGRPWRFCDAPVSGPGSAWCTRHRKIVYSGRGGW
jgi:hypothetical protein